MTTDVNMIWQEFSKSLLERGQVPQLRCASSRQKAKPWINPAGMPVHPVNQLSMIRVYDGWVNPHNKKIAKNVVEEYPDITLYQLQINLFLRMSEGEIDIPYIWWICAISCPKYRLLHEDSQGVYYIRFDNLWRPVYPLMKTGCLAGAQCAKDYESIPLDGYFFVWEDEDTALRHADYE